MECVEFSNQRKSGAVLMESTHEGQTDKQEGKKWSDKHLITCIKYVLG